MLNGNVDQYWLGRYVVMHRSQWEHLGADLGAVLRPLSMIQNRTKTKELAIYVDIFIWNLFQAAS